MAYRKKTLRTMSPTARKVARLAGELESVSRRLKNLVPELQRLDLDSKALETAKDPIRWEKVSTTHVVHDPKTGQNEIDTIFEDE